MSSTFFLTSSETYLWILKTSCTFMILINICHQRPFVTCHIFHKCFAKFETEFNEKSLFSWITHFRESPNPLHLSSVKSYICMTDTTLSAEYEANYSWKHSLLPCNWKRWYYYQWCHYGRILITFRYHPCRDLLTWMNNVVDTVAVFQHFDSSTLKHTGRIAIILE